MVAANDGLADAVIGVLQEKGLKVPVTGQDATITGMQNVLAGRQCVTIYKPIAKEAAAAAKLAVALAKGEDPGTTTTIYDPKGIRDVKSVLLESFPITLQQNLRMPFDDFALDPADVCEPDYAPLCTKYGIG